jgi:hypothetical protein
MKKLIIGFLIGALLVATGAGAYTQLQYSITRNGFWDGELVKYLENVRDLVNDIQDVLQGDNLVGTPGLAIGSTATAVSNLAFNFRVNGIEYQKAAVAAGTAPGNDVIPQSTYGAVALDIGADGTIDVLEAADNATGYASAALAIAGIAAVAADHVRMGTVTSTKSDGAFTFGTTDLDAANVTTAYTDGTTGFNTIDTNNLTLIKGQ